MTSLPMKPTMQWVPFFKEERPETGCTQLFVDCRDFHHPRGPRKHSGEHGNAVQIIVNHPHFRRWLTAFKSQLRQVSSPDNHVDVVCFCKAGINRSVTIARLIHECIKTEGELEIGKLVHVGQWYWTERRKYCEGYCYDCTNSPQSETKAEAVNDAIAVWRNL